MSRHLAILFALPLILALPAVAEELGDKTKGLAYARTVCAECHAVEQGGASTGIPSFQEISETTGMTPRALYVWLNTSHPNMPDFIIPADDIDNLVAYIMSLSATKAK